MATLKKEGHHVTIPYDIGDAIDREAEVADLSMAGAIRAILAGAIKDGQASRLIGIGVDLLPPDLTKRRPNVKRQAWKKVGRKSGDAGQASVYGQGAFRMARIGRTGKHMRPEDGWYLTGPGLDKPMFLGPRKVEAIDRANDIVASLDHKRRNEG